jgi:hypothetical protein
MIDINHKKCIECNIKRPNYNYQGETKGLYCSDCKKSDMIDVKNKKCIKCLIKNPSFNYIGETKRLYCYDCKTSDMINLVNKKCKTSNCRRLALYALPGISPEYCSYHRQEGMIRNPRKKCLIINCNEIATHGLTQSEHCESHSQVNEYNLAERTCPQCGKIDILNKDGICVNTCSLLEIDNIIKKRKKRHEEIITKLIKENIDISQILFTWTDQMIDTSCTKQRPDFVFHCGTHVVIVEVDEEQHKSYKSCGNTKEEIHKTEFIRMYNIGNIFIGLPIIFIRYNPDEFKDNNGKKKIISNISRHDIILKWIKNYINFDVNTDIHCKIRVIYLFYDGFNESNIDVINITENDVL